MEVYSKIDKISWFIDFSLSLTSLTRCEQTAIIIKNDIFLLTIFAVCQIILIFANKL